MSVLWFNHHLLYLTASETDLIYRRIRPRHVRSEPLDAAVPESGRRRRRGRQAEDVAQKARNLLSERNRFDRSQAATDIIKLYRFFYY